MHDTSTIPDTLATPNASHASCALAMMIRAPRAGASKTRLVPPLSHAEAAALSICFMRDTIASIADVAAQGNADGIAVYTPVGAEADFDGLLPETFSLLAQRGASLSDRLYNAAQDLLALGYESLCLVGSDSPTLPPVLLAEAVAALSRTGDRVVLGAAEDGGYYLIGMKSAHLHLFTEIEWSTAKVFAQTIERAAEIKLEVETLPGWYDVDDRATLRQLCEELFGINDERIARDGLNGYAAPHTRDYLAALIEREGRERVWPRSSA